MTTRHTPGPEMPDRQDHDQWGQPIPWWAHPTTYPPRAQTQAEVDADEEARIDAILARLEGAP